MYSIGLYCVLTGLLVQVSVATDDEQHRTWHLDTLSGDANASPADFLPSSLYTLDSENACNEDIDESSIGPSDWEYLSTILQHQAEQSLDSTSVANQLDAKYGLCQNKSASFSLQGRETSHSNSDATKLQRLQEIQESTIPTSAYAMELLLSGVGITDLVRTYRKNSNASRFEAYFRIRSKVTLRLANLLNSGDQMQVAEAVYMLDRRHKDDLLGYNTKKELRRRLLNYYKRKGKSGKNVTALGLPRFPQNRMHELLSTEETLFEPAADHLYLLYLEGARENKARQDAKKLAQGGALN